MCAAERKVLCHISGSRTVINLCLSTASVTTQSSHFILILSSVMTPSLFIDYRVDTKLEVALQISESPNVRVYLHVYSSLIFSLFTETFAGSARTEGYYKISHQEKCNYLSHTRGVQGNDQAGLHGNSKGAGEQLTEPDAASQTKKKVQQSREARSESRRWQSVLSSLGEDYGDLLKFNQLKVCKLDGSAIYRVV